MREIGKVVSVNVREKTAVVALPGGMVDPLELLHQTVFLHDRRAQVIGWLAEKACALADAQRSSTASSQHLTALLASVDDLRAVEELEKRVLEQRGRT